MKSFIVFRSCILAWAASLSGFASAETTVFELNGRQIESAVPVQFVEDAGAANRIEAGDVLRTISQEVPAAVCHLHNKIAPETSERLLNEGLAKFDLILDALLNGDPALGIIGAEERLKTRIEMEEVQASWAEIRDASRSVLADNGDVAAVNVVYENATDMLAKTSHLLSELEGEYANPFELLQSDVMLLEVAGRQSMMTQRISYLACRVWSGSADATYIADLATTVDQFDFAMKALLNGMPELGINPPPTEEIAKELETVGADWGLVTSHIDSIRIAENPDEAVTAELYELLAAKMHKTEAIAHLYAEFSKRGY